MAIDQRVVHSKQRKVLKLLVKLYGDDSNLILNALHEMSARLAISCGVEPEEYAAGMKHHWDHLVHAINASTEGDAH